MLPIYYYATYILLYATYMLPICYLYATYVQVGFISGSRSITKLTTRLLILLSPLSQKWVQFSD